MPSFIQFIHLLSSIILFVGEEHQQRRSKFQKISLYIFTHMIAQHLPYQMEMVAHNDKPIDQYSFLGGQKIKAIGNNVFVSILFQQWLPLKACYGYELWVLLRICYVFVHSIFLSLILFHLVCW